MAVNTWNFCIGCGTRCVTAPCNINRCDVCAHWAYALSNNAHTHRHAKWERITFDTNATAYTRMNTFTCLHLAKWIHGSTAGGRTNEPTNGRTKQGDWEGDPCVCECECRCVRIRLCVNSVVLAYIHMQHSTAICKSETCVMRRKTMMITTSRRANRFEWDGVRKRACVKE